MASPRIPQTGGGEASAPCAAEWAVGVVMVMTPCAERDAHRVLAAAAAAARVTAEELAVALAAAGPRGKGLPKGVERALRRAVVAARTAGPAQARVAPARPLVPSRARTEEALGRFRACRARLRAAPGEARARRAMDDATYTLCVLLGRPTAHEALHAARLRLAALPATPPPEDLLPAGVAV
ncbi:DUF5133 domain-containing protein [Streptomyces sp. NPDC002033]|uniref:DUF5133 domain-containing protein n=2 Tax=Streptomyces TaxID=1883 RepID=UPI00332EF6C5